MDIDFTKAPAAGSPDNPKHSSESCEHGSPPEIVCASWEVMERIDLDPASSETFNAVVEAAEFFDARANGLARPWRGRVFINPPGGLVDATGRSVYIKTKKRESCSITGSCGLPPGHKHEGVTSSAKVWWFKLIREWDIGRVEEAIFVGFSLEILQGCQAGAGGLPTPLRFPTCVPEQRLRYLKLLPDGRLVPGDQPPHGSFITYVGARADRFYRAFSRFGDIVCVPDAHRRA